MALQFRKFIDGIRVVPKSTGTSDQTGDLEVIASTGKLSYFNASETTQNSPLVTEAHSATLTDKTIDGDDNTIQNLALATLKTELSDADKVLRRDASGVVVSGNSVPDSTEIVTVNASQTLTNKTIDADLNTISNIDDSDIKVGANIARSKLAAGSADKILYNNSSGLISELTLSSGQIILGSATNAPAAISLSGDISLPYTGVATVESVGGKTKTQIATSVNDTIAATPLNTANTIVKRASDGGINIELLTIDRALIVSSTNITTPSSLVPVTEQLINLGSGSPSTVDGFSGGINNQLLLIGNQSGSDIQIKNNSGSVSASQKIITGSGADITLKDGAMLLLVYVVGVSSTEWHVVGGVGGGGESTLSIAAGEVLGVGDSIYIDGTGVAKKVDAGDDDGIEFIGVTLDAAPLGSETIRVQTSGEVTISGASFTIGKPVFVDPLTPGGYTTTAPSSAGQWVVQVGVATATDKMVINGAGSATAVKITSEVDQFIYAAVATAPGTSGAVTLTNGNSILLVDASGASRTITLPSPTAGKIFNIKKIDSSVNTVVISAPSGTIDGTATKSLTSQYDSLTITSDGSNFFII